MTGAKMQQKNCVRLRPDKKDRDFDATGKCADFCENAPARKRKREKIFKTANPDVYRDRWTRIYKIFKPQSGTNPDVHRDRETRKKD